MTSALSPDVLVDLGRSHVRVVGPNTDARRATGAGLGDRGGAAHAARLVIDAIHDSLEPASGWRLAVCAPGVVTVVAAAQQFADLLAGGFATAPGDVLVASDSAAWQCGAFAGGDGAAVALGTGAVTVARTAGRVVRLDGRGLLLGDVGGGAWIGLHGLRAADHDPDGALHAAATARFGPASGWPDLGESADLAARLASFVPDVAAAAERGDAAANAVLDAAAAGVSSTLAGLPAELPACVVGGVAPLLAQRLRAGSERPWSTPAGDAIDGLRVLLDDAGPYASEVLHGRHDPSGPASTDGHAADKHTTVGHETDLLPTEAVAPDTVELDTWPTEQLVARLAAGHRGAAQAVTDAVGPLARAAELAGRALSGTGRLVYVGAGTPGRLAVQDAAELTPTFALDPTRVPVLLAGGAVAGSRAVEGAEDDTGAGRRAIDHIEVTADDVVVGIAASGRTPFVIAALERARERGAATVAICNVAGGPLAAAADIAVELLTGPEVIAGSTRLAAGTAQKIALNTLSTAAMVRTGATYGPWMVDMVASNEKLRRRAVRIVRDAASVSEPDARAALDAADQSVQVALVMLLAGVDADAARARLSDRGSVRGAVGDAVHDDARDGGVLTPAAR